MGSELPDASAHCTRCGTCCRKGGPGLHLEDRDLVLNGKIPGRDILTIRAGEPAYDNVRNTFFNAPTDILRLKSQPGQAACIYFDAPGRTCRVYAQRPLECRVLQCRAPEALTAVYQTDRLTREDLLAGVNGLWELIRTHQTKCGYKTVSRMATAVLEKADQQAIETLGELIAYDRHVRAQVLEKSRLAPEMLTFLFGRPLSETIAAYGLVYDAQSHPPRLKPRNTFRYGNLDQ